MTDLLTMAVTAGAAIDRLLRVWAEAQDPAAAVHMAALRGGVIEQSDRTYLHSPYLADHASAADTIGTWLMRPEASARIEAAFFAVRDPRLQQLLSDALPVGAG
jgi:hypothetical protein